MLAIISFALNRVYTEFYPSRGYDFDITSTTAYDQKFIRGRSFFRASAQWWTRSSTTTSAVRALWSLSAKFCNGTTTTCDGSPSGAARRWPRRATTPWRSSATITGDDIELVVNAPIQDITQSLSRQPPAAGLCGGGGGRGPDQPEPHLPELPRHPQDQARHRHLREDTEYSVRQFQRIFNLASDGVVGKATWYKLVYLYVGVTRLSELVSEGQTFYKVQFQYPGVLREGDTGTEVQVLQYMLAVLAEFDEVIPPLTVDGVFGPSTANAVQSFQRQTDLLPDGVVGKPPGTPCTVSSPAWKPCSNRMWLASPLRPPSSSLAGGPDPGGGQRTQ